MIQLGKFTSHSGLELPWKVECDMIPNDWIHTFAAMVATKFKFKRVHYVPEGGKRFAEALRDYTMPDGLDTLIVDDVLTTGRSMEEAKNKLREDLNIQGIVIVARTVIIPDWIYPIFTLNIPFQK